VRYRRLVGRENRFLGRGKVGGTLGVARILEVEDTLAGVGTQVVDGILVG